MTRTESIRTLIVDDSEFFAQMTAETLTEEHDIDAHWEVDPEAALDRLRDRKVDCIVSDYEMPNMDGLEFLRAVQSEFEADIPFILLTGRGDEEVASQAIQTGVADYLLKLEVVEDDQYRRLANRVRNVVEQQRTRHKYELLVDNSPDVIANVATDGTILAANHALSELVDTDREDLLGADIVDVFPGDVGERRLAEGRRVVESEAPSRTEDALGDRHFHNIYVPVSVRGKEESFQLISRDITERVERERELQRQNERLEKFASVISHDLRNPLDVAQTSFDVIAEDCEGHEETFERVDRSLERMEDIIDDVLALARQGETVSEPSEVDLGSVVRDSWSYVETDSATLEVASEALTEQGQHRVEADPGRLTELLGNLFDNAVEHGGAATVTVGVTDDGFYVADDGDGIPPEERDEIFDVGHSTSRDGNGFGLNIVQEIAHAHGWEIDVTEGDGGGARFDVTGVERP